MSPLTRTEGHTLGGVLGGAGGLLLFVSKRVITGEDVFHCPPPSPVQAPSLELMSAEQSHSSHSREE